MASSEKEFRMDRKWEGVLAGLCLMVLSGCLGHQQRLLPDDIRRASLLPRCGSEARIPGSPPLLAAAPREPETIPPPPEPEPASFPSANPESPEPTDPPSKPKPSPRDVLFAQYANRFGIPLDGSENIELLRTVDEWMGAPYRWGGCSESGVDCSCLVKSIYAEVYGLDLNRTVRTLLKESLEPVEPCRLREGDLLFFDMKDRGISHVGIYLKNQAFVHAASSRGVMINRLTQPFYRSRLVKAARPRELDTTVRLARVSLEELVVVQR